MTSPAITTAQTRPGARRRLARLRARRRTGWRAALAVVAGLAVSLAFLQVLRQAVAAGELRRERNALLLEATWRCQALPLRGVRENCLRQLVAVPRDNADLLPAATVVAAPSAR